MNTTKTEGRTEKLTRKWEIHFENCQDLDRPCHQTRDQGIKFCSKGRRIWRELTKSEMNDRRGN